MPAVHGPRREEAALGVRPEERVQGLREHHADRLSEEKYGISVGSDGRIVQSVTFILEEIERFFIHDSIFIFCFFRRQKNSTFGVLIKRDYKHCVHNIREQYEHTGISSKIF